MRTAIMQPYIFPYIGYFQLINSVNYFVFYDDVSYINRGWINRNKILVNNKPSYFTISLENASQNRQINEIEIFEKEKCYDKILKTIHQNYKKAPFFQPIFNLLQELFRKDITKISELAAHSCIMMSNYLELNTKFYFSSEKFPHTKKNIDRADRLIQITKELNCKTYINAIGGKELYDKSYFKEKGIDLHFLLPQTVNYLQHSDEFHENLSIIDVLMYNSPNKIKEFLNQYNLE